MKIYIEQQEFLSEYLYKNLKYRETYTEFYDHILSALDDKPESMPFGDAVESIIAEDFDGYAGMRRIESSYKNIVTKEIRKKYLNYVTACLKFPLIGVTVVLAILFYWITKQPWFGFWGFMAIIFTMRILPGLLRTAGNLMAGYIFTKPKKSVKDSVFQWLDHISVILLLLVVIGHALDERSPLVWFKNAGSGGLTIFMLVFALHTLTFYRVYREEFKTRIAQK